jgi:hypothetical protein
MPKWNLPVDPEELRFAIQLGMAAAILQMPIDSPESRTIKLFDEETGEIQEIGIKDTVISRFEAAIAQEFGKDESKFYSIMNRIRALLGLMIEDKRCKPYLKTNPTDSTHTLMNNVLIEVMAKFPISNDGEGEFDRDIFFREVKELLKNEKDAN